MSIRLSRGVRFLVLPIACTFLSPGLSPAEETKPLSKKITQQVIQRIIPAIEAENEIAFLNASMPLIHSLKPDRMAAVDELCQQNGVTTVSERFTDLVVSKSEQGINPTRATSDVKMATIVLDGIVERLKAFEETANQHAIMQEPLVVPADFQESEELFWDVHVLHNEFESASKEIKFGQALLKQHLRRLRRDDKGQQITEALTASETELKKLYQQIAERAAVLRLQRFSKAHETLIDPASKEDFELMLTSSMVLEQDGLVLETFLKDNDSISAELLQDPELPEKVKSMIASGQEAAGDVADKANLFRNGLHYWVRGRYGAGPQVNGLLKSPEATSSMVAMKLLYMPRERNKPIAGIELNHPSDVAMKAAGTSEPSGEDDRSTVRLESSRVQSRQSHPANLDLRLNHVNRGSCDMGQPP